MFKILLENVNTLNIFYDISCNIMLCIIVLAMFVSYNMFIFCTIYVHVILYIFHVHYIITRFKLRYLISHYIEISFYILPHYFIYENI